MLFSIMHDCVWHSVTDSWIAEHLTVLLHFNICYSHVLYRLSGGDQGLLNSFFSSWPVEDISKHLPFVYNLSASSVYSYLPAFQQ